MMISWLRSGIRLRIVINEEQNMFKEDNIPIYEQTFVMNILYNMYFDTIFNAYVNALS